MKKFLFLFITVACVTAVNAQDSTITSTKKKKDWSKISLGNRANDHFMIQLGYNGWAQKPDSLNTKGLSRSLNIYFMFDFPFKSDPRFSIGIGAGVATDNVYFKDTDIDITGRTNSNRISFRNVADTNHFKKYKLATTYLEAPVELRFAANPVNTNRSWKFAIGGKIGTLMSASTKGKTLQNRNGNTINAFTQKEKAKRFFDGTRLSLTGRISRGVFGLYGAYQVNSFFKDGMGPDVRPFQIGLSISGL
jgi:hypothetical protein